MKAQMKWDQQALEAWLEESAQKDEDALTLQKYSKQDEAKIKDLVLRIEKYVDQCQKQKKLVDEETLNTMTLQVDFLYLFCNILKKYLKQRSSWTRLPKSLERLIRTDKS